MKKNNIEVDNYTVGFSEDLEFVPEVFLNPVLQLSFDANIPWVLKENPDD